MKQAPEAEMKARLDTILGVAKAWPNQDFDPSAAGNLPYISCTILRAGTADLTLDGQTPIVTGRLIATVVVEKGTGERAANEIAERISDLFPMGERIPSDDGITVIMSPAHIRDGMGDGAYWRVPVSVPFQIIPSTP